MMRTDKQRSAMRAIDAILVLMRSLADEGDTRQLVEVLDVVEDLPRLMLEREDRTEDFREQLMALRANFPAFALALDRFDHRG